MKAIQTKFFAPTGTRGCRIKASADGVPSLNMAWEYAMTADGNHVEAATQLAHMYGWLPEGRSLRSGTLPNGDMCHVLPSRTTGRTIDRAALHRLITAANRVAELFDHCPDDETAAEAGLELERAAAAIGE